MEINWSPVVMLRKIPVLNVDETRLTRLRTQRLLDLFLKGAPWYPVESHGDTHADGHAHQQDYLATAIQRIAAEQRYDNSQKTDKNHYRDDGDKRMWCLGTHFHYFWLQSYIKN